jgi:hypothetical protein
MSIIKRKYRTRDNNLLMRHRRSSGHKLLPSARNKLNLIVDTHENVYDITIMNVNDDNFDPSSIRVIAKNPDTLGLYSGALSKVHDDYECDIDSLFEF